MWVGAGICNGKYGGTAGVARVLAIVWVGVVVSDLLTWSLGALARRGFLRSLKDRLFRWVSHVCPSLLTRTLTLTLDLTLKPACPQSSDWCYHTFPACLHHLQHNHETCVECAKRYSSRIRGHESYCSSTCKPRYGYCRDPAAVERAERIVQRHSKRIGARASERLNS